MVANSCSITNRSVSYLLKHFTMMQWCTSLVRSCFANLNLLLFLPFSLPSPSSLLMLPKRHGKEESWNLWNLQTSLAPSNLSSFFFPLTFYIILFFIPAEGSTHIKIHLHGELSAMLRCHGESCSTHRALHRDARSPCWISESFTNFGEGWRTVHQKNTGHGYGWGTLQLPWSRISFWKMVKRKGAMRRY